MTSPTCDDILLLLAENLEGDLAQTIPLQVAKYHHNTDLPVSSLPTELLSSIFKAVISKQWSTRDPSLPIRGKNRSYRTIEQVCHHWREVVMDLSSIWQIKWHAAVTEQPQAKVDWLAELLRRSDPLPVSFHLSFGWSTTLQSGRSMVHLYQQNVMRITHVTLIASTSDRATLLALYPFSTMPPGLESLKIYSGYGPFRYGGELHDACKLVSLSLSGVVFGLDLFRRQQLRTIQSLDIDMSNERLGRATRPNSVEWQEILRGLPFLRDLTMRRAVGPPPIDILTSIAHQEPVYLPHLESMDLTDLADKLADFLPMLQIHLECSLAVVVSDSYVGSSLNTILYTFNSYLIAQEEPCHDWTFSIGWQIVMTCNHDEIPLSCTLQRDDDEDNIEERLQTLSNALRSHISRVLRVVILIDDAYFEDIGQQTVLGRFLAEMTHLQELEIADPNGFPFFFLMDSWHGAIALPALSLISVRNANFDASYDPTAGDVLCEYITWRAQAGHSINTVVIANCIRPQNLVQKLRNIEGLKVDWDRVVAPSIFDSIVLRSTDSESESDTDM